MKIERTQHLYVIYNPELKRTKIGISEDVKRRLCSLVCDSGCELTLCYKSIRILNANHYEKLIHDHFKEFRHLGEWFNIPPDKIIPIMESILASSTADSIVANYKDGVSIPELMDMTQMSRSGIIKHLRQSDEYNTKKSVINPIVIKKDHLMKNGVSLDIDIRVENKIYTNKERDKFCYRIYANGGFKERIFDTMDKAIRFSNNAV